MGAGAAILYARFAARADMRDAGRRPHIHRDMRQISLRLIQDTTSPFMNVPVRKLS